MASIVMEPASALAAVAAAVLLATAGGMAAAGNVGVWEQVELVLQARKEYENRYKDVAVA